MYRKSAFVIRSGTAPQHWSPDPNHFSESFGLVFVSDHDSRGTCEYGTWGRRRRYHLLVLFEVFSESECCLE